MLILIECHIKADVQLLVGLFSHKAVKFYHKVNLALFGVLEHEFHNRLDGESEVERIPTEFLGEALPRIESEGCLWVEALHRKTLDNLHNLVPDVKVFFDSRTGILCVRYHLMLDLLDLVDHIEAAAHELDDVLSPFLIVFVVIKVPLHLLIDVV